MSPQGKSSERKDLPNLIQRVDMILPEETGRAAPFTWQATFSTKNRDGHCVRDRLKGIELTKDNKKGRDRLLNPGLLLDKYVPRQDWLDEENGKGALLLEIQKYFDGQRARYGELLSDMVTRQESMLHAVLARYISSSDQPKSDIIRATVCWRLVVGMGRAHVWENALALHHLYGFPYIPGSSVKGLVRLAAFWEIADALKLEPGDKDHGDTESQLQRLDGFLNHESDKGAWIQTFKANGMNDSCYEEKVKPALALFGTTKHQGRGIFLDAIPEVFPRLEADIMNPHFQPYYQKGEPPSDDLQPSPLFFLTVGKDTVFHCPLMVLPGREGSPGSAALLSTARKWLKDAMETYGVGAKTRAGYGELEPNDQPTESVVAGSSPEAPAEEQQ